MRIDFLGIPVDAYTLQQTVDYIDENIEAGNRINHVVINAGKVVAMQTDAKLFESVVSCDLINADGQSVVWAANILGKKLPERVTGIDLMEHLVHLAAERQYKCFFFGAKEEIVRKVVDIFSKQFGNSIIAGYRNGYYSVGDEAAIARQIAESGAQLLFVAITSPRKENFMYKYRADLASVNFTMGVGGSFDVIAGLTKRAPHWMRVNGIEWLYRLIQEPRRMWKRYLFGNLKFIGLIIKEKWKLNSNSRNRME